MDELKERYIDRFKVVLRREIADRPGEEIPELPEGIEHIIGEMADFGYRVLTAAIDKNTVGTFEFGKIDGRNYMWELRTQNGKKVSRVYDFIDKPNMPFTPLYDLIMPHALNQADGINAQVYTVCTILNYSQIVREVQKTKLGGD